jgi:aryl-alcohol dehydrogenase-like predicted oxidoreductase
MKYTCFGATDLQVSKVCFGTFPLGGAWGDYDEQLALETIRTAYELGINFFDTAQAYGFGRAEELLSRALADQIRFHRAEVVLATKGGVRAEGGRRLRDSSPEWLRRGLEESLRHLGTDYVDLYQVHWPDSRTPVEETALVMADFVKEGKVRYVGVSNFDVAQMQAFEQTRKLDSLQPPYSLFMRDIEPGILPAASLPLPLSPRPTGAARTPAFWAKDCAATWRWSRSSRAWLMPGDTRSPS